MIIRAAFATAGVTLAVLASPAAGAWTPGQVPLVTSPDDGATVVQASDALTLEPHSAFVFSIAFSTSPQTAEQVRGQPPGTDPSLANEVAHLGYYTWAPSYGGVVQAATRYPLVDMWRAEKTITGATTYNRYVLPAGRYYYQVQSRDTFYGPILYGPIRSLVIPAAAAAPVPSANPAPTTLSVRTPPRVTGRYRVGRRLLCSGATFNGAAFSDSVTYGWRRNGRTVALGTTYVVRKRDRGARIACFVTHTNATSSATGVSSARAVRR